MEQLKDFLNPKSMLTPGIAGGLAVSISMPLVSAFNLKFPWVLLTVSFLFSLSVVISFKEKFLLRCVYCILNSLIIFSVSFGAGKAVDPPPSPPTPPPEIAGIAVKPTTTSMLDNMWDPGPRSAFAQENKTAQGANAAKGTSAPGQQNKSVDPKDKTAKQAADKQKEELNKYLRELKKYNEEQRKYNNKWSF